MGFTHLHVHSQYSFLDGASTLDKLLEKAKRLGMYAMALTDHNRLTGAIKFYDKAKALGMKPIIGAEVDLAGDYHLILLCKDRTGYSNLCRILTEAHLSNRGSKPCATKDVLGRFSSGLIALSGCSRGEIPSLLEGGKTEEAKQVACFFREIFRGDFFVELIHHPSRDGKYATYVLANFANELGIPTVATNNVHYATMREYKIRNCLMR
jgi:DNA polymerase III alpha subunit